MYVEMYFIVINNVLLTPESLCYCCFSSTYIIKEWIFSLASYMVMKLGKVVVFFTSGCLWVVNHNMTRSRRFPTMWYVQPAKPQISLRLRTV